MNVADVVMQVLVTSSGFLGAIVNLFILVALHRMRINARLTAVLFKTQAAVDFFTCAIIFIYKVVPTEINTGSGVMDAIFCYSWFHDNLFWLGSIVSVHSLVLVTFGLLVSVLSPIHFMLHQIRLIILAFIYLVTTSTLVFIPNCLLRNYRDGVCRMEYAIQSEAALEFYKYEGYSWIVTSYIFPAIFMITTYAAIIHRLRQGTVVQHKLSSNQNRSELQNNQFESTTTHHDTIAGRKTKKLIVTAILMSATLILFRFWETLVYGLSHLQLFVYPSDTAKEQVGVFLITVGCGLNGCIFLFGHQRLRGQLSYVLKRLFSLLKPRIPAGINFGRALKGCV